MQASRFLLAASLFLFTFAAKAEITQNFEIYGVRDQATLLRMRSLGFNQMVFESYPLAQIADQLGIKSVLAHWWFSETPWTDVALAVEQAAGLNYLTSINLMDEPMHNDPVRFPAAYYLNLSQRIHALNPALPLSLTEYGPQPQWPAAKLELFKDYLAAVDQLRIDPYPVAGGRPLRAVYDWIALAKTLMSEINHEVPLTVILQTWNSGQDSIEMPTIPQLRVMAYLAMSSEANTLSFFDFNETQWQQVPGYYEGFSALMAELQELARYYRGWELSTEILANDVVRVQARLAKKHETIEIDTNTLAISKFN